MDDQISVEGRALRFCLYGPVDGVPVIELYGTPSSRMRRPDQIAAIEHSGVRVLMPDRPGYGGSTRLPGRTVSDVVGDIEALADSQRWERFAVTGGSGGGPHALACAAFLPHRVTRCAVLSGIRPQAETLPPEEVLRGQLTQLGADILGQVEAGGPAYPGAPANTPGWEDPATRARLVATFADSLDGWYDDKVAFAQPWGFSPQSISVPVGIWYGTADEHVPESDAQWLLENIPTAQGHQYDGGHLPASATLIDIHKWVSSPTS
ncbi:alpha/beta hydrolase [Kribbella sp. NBC_00482]|uniref:alpha/beta fold hydrolase n=1 Tax=Kribbella sp. NBC_00482 TaxID=2975968 RepID=UPI002E1803F4